MTSMIEQTILFDWKTDWSLLDRGAQYHWPVEAHAQSTLGLLAHTPPDLFDGEPFAANLRLRGFLQPLLQKQPLEASNWIVKSWGGIKGHDATRFAEMVRLFGSFSLRETEAAASQLGFDRISSWSKLAAFAHPAHFAIYDSRTAATLNCLLSIKSRPERFYVPPGQGKLIKSMPRDLSASKKSSLSYWQYISALKGATPFAGSLLHAEMILFANSIKVCAEFRDGYHERK
jgi:hypothetical protein